MVCKGYKCHKLAPEVGKVRQPNRVKNTATLLGSVPCRSRHSHPYLRSRNWECSVLAPRSDGSHNGEPSYREAQDSR